MKKVEKLEIFVSIFIKDVLQIGRSPYGTTLCYKFLFFFFKTKNNRKTDAPLFGASFGGVDETDDGCMEQ